MDVTSIKAIQNAGIRPRNSGQVVCAVALVLFLLAAPLLAAQGGPPGYMNDNSDWWSRTRAFAFDDQKTVIHNHEPGSANFEILGLRLDSDLFGKAAAKLGKAAIIERGDAATGRSQACYTSIGAAPMVHLIFENGEVSESFYLFSGGPNWKGSDLCAKSNSVTEDLSVASGLRLGQAPSEVRAILGQPSVATASKLIYSYSIQKKSSAKDFEKLRPRYPELSDQELHRQYEFYTLGVYIEARFSTGRLTYLAVSKTEAY